MLTFFPFQVAAVYADSQ